MKTILSLISFLLILSFQIIAQQIPNGSFETWVNGEPEHWKTSNQSFLGLLNFTTVTKDLTDPQSGSTSVKLTVETKTVQFLGTYSMPGVLTLGKLNIDIAAQTANVTGGVPFTGRPVKLTGYYKYHPVNNDFCALGWGLTKWNTNTRDTIGFGAIDTNVTLNSWTFFEIPLTYLLPETPDTMNVLILNSNPVDGLTHTGSTLWLDNLSFDYGNVGIEGLTFAREVSIYAEPYSKQLVLSSSFAQQEKMDVSLFNMGGEETRKWKLYMRHSTEHLDISNLPSGTYVIRISTGKRILDSRKITVLN